jgi:SAM-dependent methyltransferase
MKRGNTDLPPLQAVDFDWDDDLPIPSEVEGLLKNADLLLQEYWDQWHRRPIEQYVACDFRDVYRALRKIKQLELADGNTFCEWGCGFGIVTALASQLGWEAVGIEAELFLVEQARKFFRQENLSGEILHGNFLPAGAEKLAKSQANHACMHHQVRTVYDHHDLDVDDYALIFAYPWPGEHHFQQEVFRRYAGPDSLMLMFLGPYEIELFRKASN